MSEHTHSAAVIQLARLGDFLQTTPLLAALKNQEPAHKVVVVVTPAQAPLAQGCRDVDQVVELDPGPWSALSMDDLPLTGDGEAAWRAFTARLRPLDPSLVINLNLSPLGAALGAIWPRAHQLAWWLDPRCRLTNQPWVQFVLGMVRDRKLSRLHLCDILASYASPPGPPSAGLSFEPDQAAKERARELLASDGPFAALQLGANSELRRWPMEYFAALADGLVSLGAVPVLVGSQDEAPMGSRLIQRLGQAGKKVRDLMGRTSLPELGAVLQKSRLVVSGDTGTLHLATAVGAKVLGLYMGPAQVHETGPYGPGHLVLQSRDDCGPCLEQRPECRGRGDCRFLLKPAPVLAACRALLEGDGAEQAVAGLELGRGVGALAGRMDAFGQRYQPLSPAPLTLEEALALGLREAGRVLMRPGYAFDGAAFKAELKAGHLPAGDDAAQLARPARLCAELAQAAAKGDFTRAGRSVRKIPHLAPLVNLAMAPPPDYANACEAVAGVMELCAAFRAG